MTPDEIHAWLEDNDPPFVLKTTGGRSYTVTARSNVWLPGSYPGMLCIAPTGRGIVVIKTSSIESLHIEHATAGAR